MSWFRTLASTLSHRPGQGSSSIFAGATARAVAFVEGETELIGQRLEQIGKEELQISEAEARWDTVPGIDRIAAWGLVAEMDIDMEQFPSAKHAASWGGVCPGNNESADAIRTALNGEFYRPAI